MTELKTLKDCKNLEEARQESIKWVKDLRTLSIEGYNKEWIEGRVFTFMSFFNIKEEDLK